MSKPLTTIGGLVTAVIFLALIAVSTVVYNTSPEGQARIEGSVFWRQAKVAMDTMWGYLKGDTSTVVAQQVATAQVQDTNSDIKAEWDKVGQIEIPKVINMDKVWEWRKNENGAEIIFKDKSGNEYKVPLPFKFLAQ